MGASKETVQRAQGCTGCSMCGIVFVACGGCEVTSIRQGSTSHHNAYILWPVPCACLQELEPTLDMWHHVERCERLCHACSAHTSSRSSNKLTGTLSPDFGAAWSAIEALQLSTQGFTGPLPKEWARMRSLKWLYLE